MSLREQRKCDEIMQRDEDAYIGGGEDGYAAHWRAAAKERENPETRKKRQEAAERKVVLIRNNDPRVTSYT